MSPNGWNYDDDRELPAACQVPMSHLLSVRVRELFPTTVGAHLYYYILRRCDWSAQPYLRFFTHRIDKSGHKVVAALASLAMINECIDHWPDEVSCHGRIQLHCLYHNNIDPLCAPRLQS